MWGVRGRVLSHPDHPSFQACGRGPLPTGPGCGVRAEGPGCPWHLVPCRGSSCVVHASRARGTGLALWPGSGCVCVPCLAGSGRPASRARSGAPHLSFGRLWFALCLFSPLRAGVALFVAVVAFFFFLLPLPPLAAPSLCPALRVFQPRVPWALASCRPPPFFFAPPPVAAGVSCFPVAWGLCAPPPFFCFFFLCFLFFLFPLFFFVFVFGAGRVCVSLAVGCARVCLGGAVPVVALSALAGVAWCSLLGLAVLCCLLVGLVVVLRWCCPCLAAWLAALWFSVVCLGFPLPCFVFCCAVLSCGGVLSCSAVCLCRCLRLLFVSCRCASAVCVPGCRAVCSLSSPPCPVPCCAVLVPFRRAVRVLSAVSGGWCCWFLVSLPSVGGLLVALVAWRCRLVVCDGFGARVRSGRCSASSLWCPAPLCCVLWRCAAVWCCAVVPCLFFVFLLAGGAGFLLFPVRFRLRAGLGSFLFLCSARAVPCWCVCIVALCSVLSCPRGAGWCFVLLPDVFVCLLLGLAVLCCLLVAPGGSWCRVSVACCRVSLGAVLRRVAARCAARRCVVVRCVVSFCSVWCCCALCCVLGRCPSSWGLVPSGAVFCLVAPRCVCFAVVCRCVMLFVVVLCAVCALGCRFVRFLSSPPCAVPCCAVLVPFRRAVRVLSAVSGGWCCWFLVSLPFVGGLLVALVAWRCRLVVCDGIGARVRSGRCSASSLWCPAPLCCVLWRCAAVWCCAVVPCLFFCFSPCWWRWLPVVPRTFSAPGRSRVVSVSVLCPCGAVLVCLHRCSLFAALLPSRGWLVFCVVA